MKYCDGILNFEPGMTLGQNLWVFIIIGTALPSIRKSRDCPKNGLLKNVLNVAYLKKSFVKSKFLWLYCVPHIMGSPWI